MGFMDKLKLTANEVKVKATDAVDGHGGQIKDGIEKAASFVDEKTKGKYSDKIAKGTKKAGEAVDKIDKDADKSKPADPKTTPPTAAPEGHAGPEGHAHPHKPVHSNDDQDPHPYSPPPVV